MSEPRATNDLLPLDSLAYALGKPQGSAIIKQEFSDFRVDEELAFAPSGEGDHVFIQIQKTDASTIEVAKRLSDVAAVRQADVSYSGMKDRRGETSQWFSVKLPPEKEPRLAALEDEKLAIIA
ncbi:MAG: tRNA pseudouridine(13) synthase TruD, partial [OM182 bacterium]